MPVAETRTLKRLRLIFHAGALLFIIVVAFAMQYVLEQYGKARAQTVLTGLQTTAELKTKQLDQRFRLLTDHVQRLQTLAEHYYRTANLPAPPPLREVFFGGSSRGYELTLDSTASAMQGNFLAHELLRTDAARRELQVAWWLFPTMAVQHRLDDALRWSGIVSLHSGHWAAYPYQSAQAFLQGAHEPHIRDSLLDQYSSPYLVALKSALEQHTLIWRAPSLDQAGTGYIVSLFAPVSVDQQVIAYVLADVQLSFVVALLRADLPVGMHVQIRTRDGDMIADSDGSQPSQQRSTAFYTRGDHASTLPAAGWQSLEDGYELTRDLNAVDWQIRALIDQGQIDNLVDTELLPLRKAQLALTLLMALLWWLLSRYFVTPSLQLAELATHEAIAREPHLPRIWQAAKIRLRKLIVERRVALRTLQHEREQLERQVRERTLALHNQNAELEAFNFAVSHDLRAPLRTIDGYVTALQEDYGDQLDETARRFIARAKAGAQRMEELIEALLALSQLSRVTLQREWLDLSAMAEEWIQDWQRHHPERQVQVNVESGLRVYGDRRLLRSVLDNLLGNAFKYTSKTADAQVRLYREAVPGEPVYVVADNGAGFDMQHADRLFTPFQRMHRQDEFSGTGVGLSTVQRIIHRHGGEIWAEASPGHGARFRFTVPAGSEQAGLSGE